MSESISSIHTNLKEVCDFLRIAKVEELGMLSRLVRFLEYNWQKEEKAFLAARETVAVNERRVRTLTSTDHLLRKQQSFRKPSSASGWDQLTRLHLDLTYAEGQLLDSKRVLAEIERSYTAWLAELERSYPLLDRSMTELNLNPDQVAAELVRLKTATDRTTLNGRRSRYAENYKAKLNLDQFRAGELFDESNFYQAFLDDLYVARQKVEIVSPYVTNNRGGWLLPALVKAVERGVKVTVYSKPLRQIDNKMHVSASKFLEEATKSGIELYEVDKVHQKLAFFDDCVCWEGSLNILSHVDMHEFMRRLRGTELVQEARLLSKIIERRKKLQLPSESNLFLSAINVLSGSRLNAQQI